MKTGRKRIETKMYTTSIIIDGIKCKYVVRNQYIEYFYDDDSYRSDTITEILYPEIKSKKVHLYVYVDGCKTTLKRNEYGYYQL